MWHYTSFVALQSILASQKFWLSDMTQVNDRSELTYFADVLRPIIIRKSIPKDVKARFLRETYMFGFGNAWFGYVASFCRSADRLGQWERYADRGKGIAISFDCDLLLNGGAPHHYATFGLSYNREEQSRQAERLIDYAIQLKRELAISERDSVEFWFEVTMYLFHCAVRCKSPHFAEEEEVRVVLLSTDRADAKSRDDQNGGIRHYVEAAVPFSAINGLMIGPRSSLTIPQIRHLLAASGSTTFL